MNDNLYTIEELIDNNLTYSRGILVYFDYLDKMGYGFYSKENYYSPISIEFDIPVKLSNIIIDIDASSDYDLAKITNELRILTCNSLELRIFSVPTKLDLENFLFNLNESTLRYISIVQPYKQAYDQTYFSNLKKINARLGKILFHGSPNNCIREISDVTVVESMQKISGEKCCGYIGKEHFTINIQHYSESLRFNTCLNKKLGIDTKGFIKNCPSFEDYYGHISDKSIADTLESDEFKKIWAVNKQQIETCSDCEFRTVCSDCRAFTKDPNNIYSKPLKCSYDPYSMKWEQN